MDDLIDLLIVVGFAVAVLGMFAFRWQVCAVGVLVMTVGIVLYHWRARS